MVGGDWMKGRDGGVGGDGGGMGVGWGGGLAYSGRKDSGIRQTYWNIIGRTMHWIRTAWHAMALKERFAINGCSSCPTDCWLLRHQPWREERMLTLQPI